MSKTVGVISLGCPKNLVDTEIMLGILKESGYVLTNELSAATIVIINTCAFIEDAKTESIDTILEIAELKKKCNLEYLVVTGCLPQRYKDELAGHFPEVDMFIGTGEYHKIAACLKKLLQIKTKLPKQYIGIPEYIHTYKTPRILSAHPHSVYMKIAEGCFHACSFCAIPMIRGKYRSRKQIDIVKEAKNFLASGAKELILIAQDTTAYGRDLTSETDISKLAEQISKLQGEKWIRIMYAYPQTFKKELIQVMKRHPQICRYIDIPIQHIDDYVLKNMGRGKCSEKIKRLIGYMKDEIPEITLRTSLITGFPGETEKGFNKLLKFVEKGFFDHVGVFTYSEEDGTKAASLKETVSKSEKLKRKKQILRAQKLVSKKKLKKYKGQKIQVLVEGVSSESSYLIEGRAEFQAPDIDGIVYINEGKALAGEFYSVEIQDTYDYDLVGKVIHE